MGFARFLGTGLGRSLRMVAGLVLVLCGLFAAHGLTEKVLALVGVELFAAGLFDFSLIAPLLGAPFRGEDAK